jgi:hypothetical protein
MNKDQTLTKDGHQHPRPFAPQSVPNYGGDHHVDLHRDNSRGSQNATDRRPEKAGTAP